LACYYAGSYIGRAILVWSTEQIRQCSRVRKSTRGRAEVPQGSSYP